MDPIHGVDQSQGTYWRRIHEYFHGNKKFESNRSEGSLMNRWSRIQYDVNTFCGCLTRIQDKNHSGWSVDDKIANACTLFKTEDKKNRKFAYLHCWRILKDKPKWMERRKEIGSVNKTSNKKQRPCQIHLLDQLYLLPLMALMPLLSGAADTEASGRPDGKKEKKMLRQRSTIEAVDYLMAKKKEADSERDLKKVEMCNKAFE
ncbi:glutathione S-transferase T3-like [Panicum miliaceum]|uniref:Glutathione S-transferase T3-like n=1 Tax=Panicum miliaceum TaxID=4540 RepID=A0A3L6T946_PANMI|nr:glutathione S-transferase T3-like [Panicum miliaceum]